MINFKKRRDVFFIVIIYSLIGLSLLISFLNLGGDYTPNLSSLISYIVAKTFVENFFGFSAFIIPCIFFYLAYRSYKKPKLKLPKEIMYWTVIFNSLFSLNILLNNFSFIWNSPYGGYFPKLFHTLIVSFLGSSGGIKPNIFSFLFEFILFVFTLSFFFLFFERKKGEQILEVFKKIYQQINKQTHKLKKQIKEKNQILLKVSEEDLDKYRSFIQGEEIIRKIDDNKIEDLLDKEKNNFDDNKFSTEENNLEQENENNEKKNKSIEDEVKDFEVVIDCSNDLFEQAREEEDEIIDFRSVLSEEEKQGEENNEESKGSTEDINEFSFDQEIDDDRQIEKEVIKEEQIEEEEIPNEKKEDITWPMVMSSEKKKKNIIGDKQLLNRSQTSVNRNSKQRLEENSKNLELTLNNFGIGSRVENIVEGPVVTQYQISLDAGVKVGKIFSLSDDIALSLSSSSIRISFVPEKKFLGIEVPNENREMVNLRDIVETDSFLKTKSKLPIVLGKSIIGDSVVRDFCDMPHLLIAGSTGSGKSVCVNSIITSLLMKKSPEELKLIMIDPKMVELTMYNGIPHLITPVITDPKKASRILKWVIEEMELRYRLLEIKKVRNISSYNEVATNEKIKTMPYIMVIIDEFADLMLVAKKEIEDSVSRLAAMSRAVGIHLLLATQRPSVDVITGVIKANFPSRIAFQVSSKIDSRTILDESGADQLLGKGDMLFSDPKSIGLNRIQCSFLSDDEIYKVVDDLKEKAEMQDLSEIIFESQGEMEKNGDTDELFDEALEIILKNEKASISFIQRKLKIGYNRAARIIEQMEEQGIVSSGNDQKVRKVLISH